MDITLTPEDRERFDIVRSCIDGDLTNAEAGARLGLGIRQVRRLKRAVEERGEAGIVHASRARVSNRATDPRISSAIIAFLRKKKHRDFGPTFAKEQLEKEGVTLGVETLRTLMIKEKLWEARKRRGPAIHREWRERAAMYGAMVQFDGSYHVWFENGVEHCLLAAIDDATSRVPQAMFEDHEGVVPVFRFWWRYAEEHGLPAAVYLDKFSTYKINHTSAVDNEELMTQFRRAMGELGVRVINANSPEAKGRIERLFCTLQDRLVKEMRLRDIDDRDAANVYVKKEYLPEHNARFAVDAREAGDAHREVTDKMRARLPSIFSVQSTRRVNNDFTIQFKNRWLQLDALQETTVYRGESVTIEERLDGTIHMRLKETYLTYRTIEKHERPARPRVTALTREKPNWKPPVDHPWRRAAAHAAEIKNAKKSRNAR
jgi:hypothetical protein